MKLPGNSVASEGRVVDGYEKPGETSTDGGFTPKRTSPPCENLLFPEAAEAV